MFPIKVGEAGAPGSARVLRAGFGVLAKTIFSAGVAVFAKFATVKHRRSARDARYGALVYLVWVLLPIVRLGSGSRCAHSAGDSRAGH
jgi:hypothetical protein